VVVAPLRESVRFPRLKIGNVAFPYAPDEGRSRAAAARIDDRRQVLHASGKAIAALGHNNIEGALPRRSHQRGE
jgi:hypothetical protein